MEGSITIVGLFVVAVGISILLDKMTWDLNMSFWMSFTLYSVAIFLLCWLGLVLLGVL